MLFMFGIGDILDSMSSIIDWMLKWLFLLIAQIIYPFISYLYNLFELLVRGRLLDNDIMETLSTRIGLLLGIIMFFIVIVSLIQMLVEPDKVNDKEKGAGSIIMRILVVIIMFGISSFAFNTLYYVQRIVVDSNVIGRLFIPSEINTDDFGSYLSYTLFTSFYIINPDANANDGTVIDCTDIIKGDGQGTLWDDVKSNQDFSRASECLYEKDNNNVKVIDFNWILSLGTVGFCIYFLFTYCVTIGVRMIQLSFLEIISPMAFVAYLSPKKDNMFSKWLRLYSSTFIDSFIRIAIINFAVYLISLILGDMADGSAFFDTVINTPFVNNHGMAKTFIYVIMIFAILTFAKKAPDLIKELFPAGASKLGLGFTSPKQLFDGMLGGNLVKGGLTGAAGLGIGAAMCGVGNAVRGAINDKDNRLRGAFGGLFGGLASGGLAGAKAKGIGKAFGASNKAAIQQSKRIAEWRANGGTSTLSRWGTGLQQRLGIRTSYERLEADYEDAKEYTDAFSAAKKKADSEVDKFASNYYFKDASGTSYSLLELDKMRNDDVHYSASERALFDDVYNKIHGYARDCAMENNGAVKSGTVTWTDNGTGNWDDIESSRSISSGATISNNSEIEQNMEYILGSDVGKASSGNRLEKAKAANDSYEKKVNAKINDTSYKASKANYDATKEK